MNNRTFKTSSLRKLVLACGLFIAAFTAKAQQVSNANWPDVLVGNVKQFTQKFAPQKVHLHTGSSFFVPTDTVWFKAYVVDAASLMPVSGPEVITVRLISEDKKPVLTHKIATRNGLAAGQLVLPDSLLAGNYTLVAYTNWMRNFGSEYFFRKPLTILRDTGEKPAKTGKTTLAAFNFFPEGGNLVQGLKSRVGFKAVNEQGLGLPVEGQIVDETGKVAVSFKSQHAGMGSFLFTPLANKRYTAQVTYGNKQKQTFALPKVLPQGVVLTVTEAIDSISTVTLEASPARQQETFFVVVQSRGFIVFLKEMKAGSGPQNRFKIPKKELRDGLAQVTVFDQAGKPEAERLIFVNNQRQLNIQLQPEKTTFGRKEAVKVNVKVTDENGTPLQTELSLSVSDLKQAGAVNFQQNILSNFLLTSDLAGNIENPGYYFQNDLPATRQALDNLLLTQGWRRFTWTQVAEAGKIKPTYKREPELVLNGTVENNKYPVGNAVIYLLDHQTGESEVIIADENGKFSIYSDGNKATQLYTYQVWQNSVFLPNAQLKTATDSEIAWPEFYAALAPDSIILQRNTLRVQIGKAFGLNGSKVKKAAVAKERAKNWLLMAPDKTYELSKYESLKDFEEVLKEIVRDVRVLTATAEPETRMVSKDKRDFFQHPPMYFIDGQPTWNNELILRLNAELIREINIYNSIKTLRQFGSIGNQGVISIKTKGGNFTAPELESQNRLEVPGVTKIREFYVPPVAAASPQVPDFRPLIYWNPSLKTDAAGNATVTFPTSDALSNFRIYAEGISATGTPGNGSVEIKTVPAQ